MVKSRLFSEVEFLGSTTPAAELDKLTAGVLTVRLGPLETATWLELLKPEPTSPDGNAIKLDGPVSFESKVVPATPTMPKSAPAILNAI